MSNDELNILPKPKITVNLIVLTSLAVIGGFLFGYDCGVVTGALLYLKVFFKLTDWTEEVDCIFEVVLGKIGFLYVFYSLLLLQR